VTSIGRAAGAALVCCVLACLASPAEARLGLGEPVGDRGSRSNSPVPATPTAPLGVRQLPGRQLARAAAASVPAAASSPPVFDRVFRFVVRRPIVSAWLGSFGFSFLLGSIVTGSGVVGFFSFWIALFVLLPVAGFVTVMRVARGMLANFAPGLVSAAARVWGPAPLLLGKGSREAHIGRGDLEVFQRTLEGLQEAWTEGDLPALASGTTPQLQAQFARQFELLASRGERDRFQHLRLEQADLAEGWAEDNAEGSTDWATVTWRMSGVDWRERTSNGEVTAGSKVERNAATEAWTFVRLAGQDGRGGGPWQLAAIQPVA